MGMSLHVIGYQEADLEWSKMKEIWDQCAKAGVTIPIEVLNFFNGEYPGDKPGREIDISEAVSDYRAESREGFSVRVKDIPEEISTVRFFYSI